MLIYWSLLGLLTGLGVMALISIYKLVIWGDI